MSNLFKAKLQSINRKLPSLIKRLPGIIQVEGLRFIDSNFEKQGFQKRKGSVDKWKDKKAKGARKPILVGEKRGGFLKKSWHQDTRHSETRVEFTSNHPAAAVHNEGLMSGKPPGFKMPERKMIGDSDLLNNDMIGAKLDKEMKKVFL